jgi:hypothetical protein
VWREVEQPSICDSSRASAGLAPGTRFAVLNCVAIDRRTQDSDVMERVLGIDDFRDNDEVRTEVIDLSLQPWLAGAVATAVQLTFNAARNRRPRQKSRR